MKAPGSLLAITRLRASVVVLICGVLCIGAAHSAAKAYRPSDAAQVVLRFDGAAELARWRREIAATPNDVGAWNRYVRALIAAGERTGHERYYGYAEQALASAPADVQVELSLLRAQLLQQRHEFRTAETLLTEHLRRTPRDPDALLMRAQIRLHLNEPEQALRDCTQLTLLTDLLISSTCTAQARAALGPDLAAVQRAYELVTTLLNSTASTAVTRSWSMGIAAELAARLGKNQQADHWYRLAFELEPENHFARLAYVDWLLANGDVRTAYEIARNGRTMADRLRAVLARPALDSAEARRLQLAWSEATARGECAHLRDQARFELLVLKDVARAHATALENFKEQRTAEDALLLAQTATQRGDRKALALVKEWQAARRYADRRLSALFGGQS